MCVVCGKRMGCEQLRRYTVNYNENDRYYGGGSLLSTGIHNI